MHQENKHYYLLFDRSTLDPCCLMNQTEYNPKQDNHQQVYIAIK